MSWGPEIPISKHSRLDLAVAPRGYMVQVTPPFANALWVLAYKNSSFHSLPPACNTSLGHLSFLSQKSQSRILQRLACHPWILLILIKKGVALVNKSTYFIIIGRIDNF